jgi:hypothetical protein
VAASEIAQSDRTERGPCSDPEAMAESLATGHGKRRPTRHVRLQARALHDEARRFGCYESAIGKLLGFVAGYPAIEEFQKIVARLLHESSLLV